jgi:glycosyltransferase involved in cell wall biosynthesis
VFTGGQSLFEAKKHRHSNIHPFPSGIDARHFAKMNRRGADPDDQAHIPFPRVGFFGVVDERLDIALVKELAHRLPNFQFIMIGPVAKIDSASLPQAPNIHWLGSKQYSDLPSYLHHWDVGFMPFALNDATRYISPTKTPEFLAAGLRVVSTPIIDVVRTYGGKELIEIAGNVEEFVVSLHHCINKENQDAWQSKADRHLATISWDLTWRLMQTLFLSSRSKQPGHSPRFYRSGEYVV